MPVTPPPPAVCTPASTALSSAACSPPSDVLKRCTLLGAAAQRGGSAPSIAPSTSAPRRPELAGRSTEAPMPSMLVLTARPPTPPAWSEAIEAPLLLAADLPHLVSSPPLSPAPPPSPPPQLHASAAPESSSVPVVTRYPAPLVLPPAPAAPTPSCTCSQQGSQQGPPHEPALPPAPTMPAPSLRRADHRPARGHRLRPPAVPLVAAWPRTAAVEERLCVNYLGSLLHLDMPLESCNAHREDAQLLSAYACQSTWLDSRRELWTDRWTDGQLRSTALSRMGSRVATPLSRGRECIDAEQSPSDPWMQFPYASAQPHRGAAAGAVGKRRRPLSSQQLFQHTLPGHHDDHSSSTYALTRELLQRPASSPAFGSHQYHMHRLAAGGAISPSGNTAATCHVQNHPFKGSRPTRGAGSSALRQPDIGCSTPPISEKVEKTRLPAAVGPQLLRANSLADASWIGRARASG